MSEYSNKQERLRIAEENLNPIFDESGRVIEFTIDRRAWARGGVNYNTVLGNRLLNRDLGTRCCMGFYGLACGMSNRSLENQATFGSVVEVYGYQTEVNAFPEQLKWLVEIDALPVSEDEDDLRVDVDGMDTSESVDLAFTNDRAKMSDGTPMNESERERIIAENFAQQGITVHFIN